MLREVRALGPVREIPGGHGVGEQVTLDRVDRGPHKFIGNHLATRIERDRPTSGEPRGLAVSLARPRGEQEEIPTEIGCAQHARLEIL